MMNKQPADKLLMTLREYEDNPFIAKLPSLLSQRELVRSLASRPEFNEQERNYPTQLRKHCIMRLGRYFEPLERQIQLAERFGMLLRQGYIGRNPQTHDYIRHLQNGIERIEAKSLHVNTLHPVENTAASFALTGCSGIGKSKSIEKVLHQYRQTIQHTDTFSLVQIVWLKLDCPHQGSPKQLCISFFSAVDRLLGTNYLKWYGSRRTTLDEMMVHMAHVANLHALGVLVIDEIQHLNRSKVGPEALLNFLVTLVNTIGVPVILIGTLSAVPLLQENFRQARRASGLGSLIWDRMPRGNAWDHFIDCLWKYQWTRDVTPISPDIREVLYSESQGILDVVVKLFMLAQLRVIGIAEARRSAEIMNPELFAQVAREDFRIIQPMLNALRTNDTKALLKYDDLMPLQSHVQQLLETAMQIQSATSVQQPRVYAQSAPSPEISTDGGEQILSALCTLGVADDMAQLMLHDARINIPSTDPLLLMAAISERLARGANKPKRTKKSKVPLPVVNCKDDLRQIVEQGIKLGQSGYKALLTAGWVTPPLPDFAE